MVCICRMGVCLSCKMDLGGEMAALIFCKGKVSICFVYDALSNPSDKDCRVLSAHAASSLWVLRSCQILPGIRQHWYCHNNENIG